MGRLRVALQTGRTAPAAFEHKAADKAAATGVMFAKM
jgi:hypothetical protein